MFHTLARAEDRKSQSASDIEPPLVGTGASACVIISSRSQKPSPAATPRLCVVTIRISISGGRLQLHVFQNAAAACAGIQRPHIETTHRSPAIQSQLHADVVCLKSHAAVTNLIHRSSPSVVLATCTDKA